MCKKPLTSLAGLALACVMLIGCGHGAGYRRPNSGLGTPSPSNSGQAQARTPTKPMPGLGSTTTGSQGSPITPAGLAPGSSNSSAGKPFQTSPGDSTYKLDQSPSVVATSTGLTKPAASVTAPLQSNSQGYKIPNLPSQDKPTVDPSVRQTTVPMGTPMAPGPFREDSIPQAPAPASSSQPAPSPDWSGGK